MNTMRRLTATVAIGFALATLSACSAAGEVVDAGVPPPGGGGDLPTQVSSGAQFDTAPGADGISR